MSCYVYEIFCKGNNKIYVGVSCNPSRRLKEHIAKAYYKESKQYNLHKDATIRKYGKESLILRIVYEGTRDSCLNTEVNLIREYMEKGICLNGSSGGEGSEYLSPWNKGTKGVCKPNKTSFKKGAGGNLKLTLKQEQDICKMYSEGFTYKEIHKTLQLSITVRCIKFCLDRYGLCRRKYVSEEDVLNFKNLHNEGVKLKEISDRTGFGKRTISEHLKRLREENNN